MDGRVMLLFPFCKLVKGYARSAIYDLEAKKVYLISNKAHSFISTCKGKSLSEIYTACNDSDRDVINSLITFLVNNGLIYWIERHDYPHFLPVASFMQTMKNIDNVIIDIGAESQYNIKDAIEKIKHLYAEVIQLRILYPTIFFRLREYIEFTYHTGVPSIQMVASYRTIGNTNLIYSLVDDYQNITTFFLYNAPQNKTICHNQCKIVLSMDEADAAIHNIVLNKFVCNKRFFFESRNRNVYLSRKCCIDRDGKIKNAPLMPYSYGNIDNIRPEELLSIIKSERFTRIFYAKKDDMPICEICEFRYACFDSNLSFSVRSDGVFFETPTKCNYNPYTAQWKQSSKNG